MRACETWNMTRLSRTGAISNRQKEREYPVCGRQKRLSALEIGFQRTNGNKMGGGNHQASRNCPHFLRAFSRLLPKNGLTVVKCVRDGARCMVPRSTRPHSMPLCTEQWHTSQKRPVIEWGVSQSCKYSNLTMCSATKVCIQPSISGSRLAGNNQYFHMTLFGHLPDAAGKIDEMILLAFT